MATAKKATATKTATKATVATKTATKKVAPVVPAKLEMVKLGNSNYHYWRHFLKSLFRENGIVSAKWVKNEENYDGVINIAKAEKVKAEKVYKDYVTKQDCKDLMW